MLFTNSSTVRRTFVLFSMITAISGVAQAGSDPSTDTLYPACQAEGLADGSICRSASGRKLIVHVDATLGTGFQSSGSEIVYYLPRMMTLNDGLEIPEAAPFSRATEICASRGAQLPTPAQAAQIDPSILALVSYLNSEIWTNKMTYVRTPEMPRGTVIAGAHTWIWKSSLTTQFQGALYGRDLNEAMHFVCVR